MTLDQVGAFLVKLASVFGPLLAVFLVLVVLGFLLGLGYLFLAFGRDAMDFMKPYCRELMRLLTKDVRNEHAALRVERYAHVLFGLLALASLVALIGHVAIPWSGAHGEEIVRTLVIVLLASIFVEVLMLFMSFKVALHV